MRERLLLTLASAGVPVDRCPAVVGPGLVRASLTFVGSPTQSQLDACDSVLAAFDWSDAAHAAWLLSRQRDTSAAQLSDPAQQLVRAVVLVLVDEINALRDWITSFKAATAAASNLANLQTRVAALASTPDRTGTQARAAVLTKLAAGDADT